MKHLTTIQLPKLSGNKVIADSTIFSYIDSDFRNWKADEKGKPTKAMKIDVFEMDTDATFAQMMSADNLMTQDQIIYFCKNHKDLLRHDGYATFFPFKSNGKVFVAFVYVKDGGLKVLVYRFSDDCVWSAEYRHRVVVPTISTSEPLTPSHSDVLPNELNINGVMYIKK